MNELKITFLHSKPMIRQRTHISKRNHFFFISIFSCAIIFNAIFFYFNYSQHLFHFQYYILDQNKVNSNSTFTHENKNNTITDKSQPFPIDLVYTWVNSSDPDWIKSYTKERKKLNLRISNKSFISRYYYFEELRYSLRTVEKFALPMINKIYIVTANQIPSWFNQDIDIIKFVPHSDIFPPYCSYMKYKEMLKTQKQDEKHQEKCLPTFSSNAIEFSLVNIPNLSEHFIYINDDMYFGRKVEWSDFYTIDGKPKFISDDKEWKHARSELKMYQMKYIDDEQGGKQFSAMVLNTIVTFMNQFKLKNAMNACYSHIPFPMTKSLIYEIIDTFTEDIDDTIQSRFRRANDLQLSNLMIQYGLYKNKGVKVKSNGKLNRFFVTDTEFGFYRLAPYARKVPKLFCINADSDAYQDKIRGFLENVAGEMSIFEKENLKNQAKSEDKEFWFLNETRKRYDQLKKIYERPAPRIR